MTTLELFTYKGFLVFIILCSILACSGKTKKQLSETDTSQVSNELIFLSAIPDKKGYLPLEVFSENSELYARYIKNGKRLEKIALKYNHSEQVEHDEYIFFDELVNGRKAGVYRLLNDGYRISYISTKNDTINYRSDNVLFKEHIMMEPMNLVEAEKTISDIRIKGEEYIVMKEGTDNEYYITGDEMYFKNLAYLIHVNPQTLDYRFDQLSEELDLQIVTSDDGNLRFYIPYYYVGGMGHGSTDYEVIAQFRSGKDVFTINGFEYTYFGHVLAGANFFYTINIEINTLNLDGKVYYLVDIATNDGHPGYDSTLDGYRDNGNILRLYSIENGELIANKMFNTTKDVLDEIVVEFGDKTWETRGWRFDEAHAIFYYDSEQRSISFPLINKLQVTDKCLFYQWDGQCFTYKGIR